jgi:hypothetical protein
MPYDRTFMAKVFPALQTAFDDTLGSIYDGKIFATVKTGSPDFPYCVYQSQDGGGVRADYLDQNGWNGLITFRSLDTTLSGAWNRTLQILQALPAITGAVPGFYIDYIAERPQWFPVEKLSTGYVYTAGIIVSFTMSTV